jgi:hypothetical protein
MMGGQEALIPLKEPFTEKMKVTLTEMVESDKFKAALKQGLNAHQIGEEFSLNRSNLEKMYLVYIRPLFEYACEIWDNCGIGYSDKLEKIQLDAARIVTGLPIFTKSEYLYAETGWETLSERRYRRKLQFSFDHLHIAKDIFPKHGLK